MYLTRRDNHRQGRVFRAKYDQDKGRAMNVRDIGSELGVAHVLEGSVQKACVYRKRGPS